LQVHWLLATMPFGHVGAGVGGTVVVVVALQEVLPAGDHVPGEQLVHVDPPAEMLKVPAGQGWHESWPLM
jgi:hypothetical protein